MRWMVAAAAAAAVAQGLQTEPRTVPGRASGEQAGAGGYASVHCRHAVYHPLEN